MKFKFSQLRVGQTARRESVFSEELVSQFARITGDNNPIHLDKKAAAETIFGKPIVHGLLVSGMFSAILGTELPGEGSVYLRQDLKFMRPVFVGDRVSAQVKILEVQKEKKRVVLETLATNQNDETVIQGEAVVKILGDD